jgi:hypothetical protein
MSTQETTTQSTTPKQAKASKKTAKAKKATTAKKTSKMTKTKGAAKSGSKAAIVLELMKRKEAQRSRRLPRQLIAQIEARLGFDLREDP